MMSSFAWLDGSERQRRQMRDLLSQFKEQGTRDELGLSVIRDTFADLLFPGTGTLQTRARYFFFVPWQYLDLERRKVSPSEIERRARKSELDLVETLKAAGGEGTIGARAGRSLQRLPSSIYWSGLRRLGFLTRRGSQEDFHRSFGASINRRVTTTDDGEIVGAAERRWHAKLPAAPPSFPEAATFALTRDEADFLVDRIRLSAPKSFFSWWVESGLPDIDAKFAWGVEAPADHLTRELRHARNFSETMLGAAILYNLFLNEIRKDTDQARALIIRFDTWYADLDLRALRNWDVVDLWRCLTDAGAQIEPTRPFVQKWLQLVTNTPSAAALRDSDEARTLIDRRERELKGKFARITNARALELWGGSSGLGQFDFRWGSAVRIGRDILEARGDA